MGQVLVEEKSVVVPGEVLADGMDFLPGFGTYRKGDKILALQLGLAHVDGRAIKLISLSGKYFPKRNDVIIGKVIDVMMSGWRIDLNCAYSAMLGMKDATSEFIQKGTDLTQYFALGDYIVTKVVNVTSQRLIDVSTRGPGLRKLSGGRIITINPNKVPRVIGKQGSMVTMIKETTGCRIIVGQNGRIWLAGEPENEVLAVKTIKKIEAESHVPGLTEKIKVYLDSKKKEVVKTAPEKKDNEEGA
jgi:exosome complex component RRP4